MEDVMEDAKVEAMLQELDDKLQLISCKLKLDLQIMAESIKQDLRGLLTN